MSSETRGGGAPSGGAQASEKRARVAIARTGERHRSFERIYGLAKQAIDQIGGINQYVKPGQRVLIKPNQTVFYAAEEGITTDPYLVQALVRMAYEAGASHVQVAESSGDVFPSLKVMSITGVKAVAEKEGAEVLDLKEAPTREVSIPNALVMPTAQIPEPLLDADVIIDAPKAKTHEHEHLSCALKNWVGTLHQSERKKVHSGPETAPAFMDIMSVTRPHLVVVDAIICGEGNGPIGNQPYWNGCVFASNDPVATDVTVARMMGIDWQKLRYPVEAEKHGIGVRDPDRIDIIGVPLAEVSFNAWTGHNGMEYLPFNVIVGEEVYPEGTTGHVKAILDAWLKMGIVQKVMYLKGTPTFLIGKAEDPNFEEHLKEGPYIVIDDAAPEKYKNDPRVHFVPGHPVTGKALPGVLEGLGIKMPGKMSMRWQEFQQWGMHNTQYGTPAHRAKTLAVPVVAAVAAAGATYAAVKLLPGGKQNGD